AAMRLYRPPSGRAAHQLRWRTGGAASVPAPGGPSQWSRCHQLTLGGVSGGRPADPGAVLMRPPPVLDPLTVARAVALDHPDQLVVVGLRVVIGQRPVQPSADREI